jgi:NADH:ubiquinone oxidoreductase subunit C
MLHDLTAIDWKDRYELAVHLKSIPSGHQILVRVPLAKQPATPEIPPSAIQIDATAPTLSHLYDSALWAEREVFDLFGIRFDGHPDLRRMFLDDDFTGHPLRKDYPYPPAMIARPY